MFFWFDILPYFRGLNNVHDERVFPLLTVREILQDSFPDLLVTGCPVGLCKKNAVSFVRHLVGHGIVALFR